MKVMTIEAVFVLFFEPVQSDYGLQFQQQLQTSPERSYVGLNV
jgi:hypothetical protein